MPTEQKSLRIRSSTLRVIEEIARERASDFSTVANDFLAQAARMARCPGIVYAPGPTVPRARIAGTGIEVWEVVATYRSLRKNLDRLRRAYPQLSNAQLLAALNYYRHFKTEIDRFVKANAAWTPAKLRSRYAFAAGAIK